MNLINSVKIIAITKQTMLIAYGKLISDMHRPQYVHDIKWPHPHPHHQPQAIFCFLKFLTLVLCLSNFAAKVLSNKFCRLNYAADSFQIQLLCIF